MKKFLIEGIKKDRETTSKGRQGFTLIEVVITLSVIAILAAIITPLVISNLDQAKLTRAASDSKTLGEALLKFKQDLGVWPIYGTYVLATRVSSNPTQLLHTAGTTPAHTGAGETWNRGPRITFNYFLTDNTNGYPPGPSPTGTPVWNGPYADANNTDPWDNAYLCNVNYLDGGAAPNPAVRILVISAGPDRVTTTPFDTTAQAGGDDIAFRVR